MLVVGLTGGIGSGKTLVTEMFAELNVTIIDADQISRQLTAAGQPVLQQLRAAFGDGIFNADLSLNRNKLRQWVFDDPQQLQKLESILHPQIREMIIKKIKQLREPYIIVSVPLLIEKDFQPLIDRLLVVDVTQEIQVKRVQQRDGLNTSQVRAIMDRQISREKRLAEADDIIDNSGNPDQTRLQVRRLHERYLEISAAKP